MFLSNILQLLSIFSISTVNEDPKVTLPHGGVLVGHKNTTTFYGRTIVSYLGIPYALPPTNERRFADPVPYGSWKGEIKAQNYKIYCPQPDFLKYEAGVTGSEDCLYLNVYVPEKPKKKGPLPVIFWIYGGANESGTSSAYEPDYLLDHDVILVAPTFRVGPLGFLSTETLECPGNFAYKDQLLALKWTQQNIAAFGGNPKQVTIFGESAGAASVSYHMLSEQSKGLFQQAIMHSASHITNWAYPLPKGVAANNTRQIANSLGCDGYNTDWTVILDCLRTKPANEITDKIRIFHQWKSFPLVPITGVIEPKYDGAFLTEIPLKVKNPHGNSLPLLTGYNKDEGIFISPAAILGDGSLEEFKQHFDEYLPLILKYEHKSESRKQAITESLKKYYFKDGPTFTLNDYKNFTDTVSDSWIINGVDEIVRQRIKARKSGPTFTYYFQHEFQKSLTEYLFGQHIPGISHFDEMQALYPVRGIFQNNPMNKENLKVRNRMIELWINFVKNGVPSSSDRSIPEWTPANEYPPLFMHIGKENNLAENPIFAMQKVSIQSRLDLWHELAVVAN